ncbi:MAG TPA: glycosyltransferase family 2 protein [Actinocrinis sp.]|jgi:glycosyltransferase involved in cell wall biosynthesis
MTTPLTGAEHAEPAATVPAAVPRTLIIIPAWNESASIAGVIGEIGAALPFVDVLVVDDGSRDDTAAAAKQAGATALSLPYNLGVGGAMRLGYRYARDHGYDVAIQVDADGQHDPAYVPKLLDGLSEASLVIGARFAGEGDYEVHGPRKWAMSMLSFVISRLARTKLTDTTSGFRACNRELIELFADWYPVEYLGDTVETLVRTIRLHHPVAQIPVTMRQRQSGTPSQSPAKAMLYLGRAFFALVLALSRR